ncbi:MAG: FAD/NAD(P)-binding oxidoreductase [Candidatus Altiarchaeales archaeon ex4484_96]|nr:MAG: FAD/NAD(P)-binding oxidoreductase [Candidatus Altiarchaeales archaeon ex4484_96]
MSEVLDYLIVGGGVVGCNIARELSRFDLKTVLCEKECDVAMGTSGRNSGVAHAGFYMIPKTLKAELNVRGHQMLPALCEEIGAQYNVIGKLVVAEKDDEIPYLLKLKRQGEINGTQGLRLIDADEVSKIEPNIRALKALYSPTSAILDPFQLTIGLAENALINGARIELNTEVLEIKHHEDYFTVETNKGSYKTRNIINSAGLYADKISALAGVEGYRIYPCRGEYHVLDKGVGHLLNTLVYPVPPKDSGGLGVHLTPTVDGNIMLGPSADYINEPCDLANTPDVMNQLLDEARLMLPALKRKDFIRSFAGNRPKLIPTSSNETVDYVIKEEYEGFINLVGIESPGLTAAPAIAERVIGLIKKRDELIEKKSFNPKRDKPVRFSRLTDEQKARLIAAEPAYGQIVCRCETVTKKEVLDALHNPLGAKSINSIKIRSRASMGRCQGGFCWPKIVQLIEDELKPELKDIRLCGAGSNMFIGKTKDLRRIK